MLFIEFSISTFFERSFSQLHSSDINTPLNAKELCSVGWSYSGQQIDKLSALRMLSLVGEKGILKNIDTNCPKCDHDV